MSHSELKQAISALQSALDGHEKIALAFFARKLHKTSEQYPEDQTIGQMSMVVDRMNNGNRLSITRAEVKDLYQKLFSRNTKFAQLFSDELGLEPEKAVSVSPTETQYKEFDIYKDVDQSMLKELTASFDPEAVVFSPEIGREAANTVAMECSFPGLVAETAAVSGDANCVVVQASYQTSKGKAVLYVPVEMNGKYAAKPDYFMGRDGSHYISKKSIAGYVDAYFDKVGSFGNSSVGEKLEELAETPVNQKNVDSFSEQLSTVAGVAHFQHGDKCERGRRLIAGKLQAIGNRAGQIKILDASENSITYGVSCNGISFKVPVKIESGRIQDPTVIICKGSLSTFDAAGIQEFQQDQHTDNQVAAMVSPMFNLKASDLIEVVREAAAEENYAKAEDALNVLQNSGDEKAYRVAFAEFTDLLAGVKKEAEVSKCSRIIRTANSTQPICSHLNLPVHKVYQDKRGECCPLYRKNQSETYEGAYFMNSKIFQ